MLTKQDEFLGTAAQDILLALGSESERAWLAYRTLIDRLTCEVEGGEYASVTPKEVGCLHLLLGILDIDKASVPSEFQAVLARLDINKNYHGHAMIGMGDLVAIRSLETVLPALVEGALYQRLRDKPLLVRLLREIRENGRSRGIVRDMEMATSLARCCLTLLSGMAVSQNGAVTDGDIRQIYETNGLDSAPRLNPPTRFEHFFMALLEEEQA